MGNGKKEDKFASKRERMIQYDLKGRGINDARIIEAMNNIHREDFVPQHLHSQAYYDGPLPIGNGQTISQPYIVALMTEELRVNPACEVLEIGTGSGYQTAILAEMAQEVISIERFADLSKEAAALLGERGYRNVTLAVGDGTLGWPSRAPYDRIIVTAAAARSPPALFEQLTEKGILVIPVGEYDYQRLQVIRKVDGSPRSTNLSPCRFVPLVGAQGWPE